MRTGVTTVVVPVRHYGGFSPWGFGGLGFGSYYGGFYDPFGPWYGGYSSYYYPGYTSYYWQPGYRAYYTSPGYYGNFIGY